MSNLALLIISFKDPLEYEDINSINFFKSLLLVILLLIKLGNTISPAWSSEGWLSPEPGYTCLTIPPLANFCTNPPDHWALGAGKAFKFLLTCVFSFTASVFLLNSFITLSAIVFKYCDVFSAPGLITSSLYVLGLVDTGTGLTPIASSATFFINSAEAFLKALKPKYFLIELPKPSSFNVVTIFLISSPYFLKLSGKSSPVIPVCNFAAP